MKNRKLIKSITWRKPLYKRLFCKHEYQADHTMQQHNYYSVLDKLKDNDWYEELDLTGTKWIVLRQEETNQLLDYITNLQEENQRLKKYNKICKKYLHNHERDYVDELGSICCKPSEYFNIAWAQDILNGDIEGFEDLLQGSDE